MIDTVVERMQLQGEHSQTHGVVNGSNPSTASLSDSSGQSSNGTVSSTSTVANGEGTPTISSYTGRATIMKPKKPLSQKTLKAKAKMKKKRDLALEGKWNADEDRLLRQICKEFAGEDWDSVATSLALEYTKLMNTNPDVKPQTSVKTEWNCMHRYYNIIHTSEPNRSLLNASAVKGKGSWTPREDSALRRLVEKYGQAKWSFIGKFLPGRVGKQCRERWHNHLNPSLKKTPWSSKEDQLIILQREKLGNRWAQIARMMPGRSDNDVKNRWYASLKKRVERAEKEGIPILSVVSSSAYSSKTKKLKSLRQKKSSDSSKSSKGSKKSKKTTNGTGDSASSSMNSKKSRKRKKQTNSNNQGGSMTKKNGGRRVGNSGGGANQNGGSSKAHQRDLFSSNKGNGKHGGNKRGNNNLSGLLQSPNPMGTGNDEDSSANEVNSGGSFSSPEGMAAAYTLVGCQSPARSQHGSNIPGAISFGGMNAPITLNIHHPQSQFNQQASTATSQHPQHQVQHPQQHQVFYNVPGGVPSGVPGVPVSNNNIQHQLAAFNLHQQAQAQAQQQAAAQQQHALAAYMQQMALVQQQGLSAAQAAQVVAVAQQQQQQLLANGHGPPTLNTSLPSSNPGSVAPSPSRHHHHHQFIASQPVVTSNSILHHNNNVATTTTADQKQAQSPGPSHRRLGGMSAQTYHSPVQLRKVQKQMSGLGLQQSADTTTIFQQQQSLHQANNLQPPPSPMNVQRYNSTNAVASGRIMSTPTKLVTSFSNGGRNHSLYGTPKGHVNLMAKIGSTNVEMGKPRSMSEVKKLTKSAAYLLANMSSGEGMSC
eukprot:g2656.t1